MVNQLTDAELEACRADVKAFLKTRPDLTMADFAQFTTLGESTGRAFLNGAIRGGREVVSEMKRVLDLARAGDILQPGGRAAMVISEEQTQRPRRVKKQHNFYETQTVARIAEVLEYCAEHATIGVVTADFGVGKTYGVNYWRRTRGANVESLVFEFDEFTCANKVDFVIILARMLGIEANAGFQQGSRVFQAVCERLKKSPALLIFDQCETVRPRVCQIIRQIWDRTHMYGVGVVMLSAPVLLARLNGSRAADLGALSSRIGIWAPLTGLTKAEMAAILKQEQIAEIDDSAFDLWWKATGGSMRRLMRSLDLIKAKHAGKRIKENTIAGVAGYLWGMSIQGVEA